MPQPLKPETTKASANTGSIRALASHLQDTNPDAAVRILTACGSNQEHRAAYTDAIATLNRAFELERTTNGASTEQVAEILNLTGIVQW